MGLVRLLRIRCGFTIPIQDGQGPIAAVTFASDEPRHAFLRTIEGNRRVLQLMAILLHAHARKKLFGGVTVAGAHLTSRELQCLELAAKGKSAWESAKLIGIAERTVTFHIENAKRKLGVRTKLQAIAMLAQRNASRPH